MSEREFLECLIEAGVLAGLIGSADDRLVNDDQCVVVGSPSSIGLYRISIEKVDDE